MYVSSATMVLRLPSLAQPNGTITDCTILSADQRSALNTDTIVAIGPVALGDM
jgi:hypothetical protein